MLKVDKVIAFPSAGVLDEILAADTADIISPFYSGWALEQLEPARHNKIRLITRLPSSFASPPPFLDNDPRPLQKALRRMGDSLSVYAMPTVHAKLYLVPSSAWVGSANFTRTGFSGVGELLLRVSPPTLELSQHFRHFLRRSTPISLDDIDFLVANVRSGLTKLTPELSSGKNSGDAPMELAVSYADFGHWIERRSTDEATYINDRIHNKYRMSGHSYSGFHGVFSFLRRNPVMGRRLLKKRKLPIPDDIIQHLSAFVARYGDQFGGPRGGTWRSKLSVRLGGIHIGGGAGDVMVKRLLLEVPRYMRARGLL
jgi:hypothetical protein